MRYRFILFLLLSATAQAQIVIPSQSQQIIHELIAITSKEISTEQEKLLFQKYPLINIKGQTYVSAFGKVHPSFDPNHLPEHFYVGTRVNDIITLKIPLNDLQSIHQLENITHIQMSPKVIPNLDRAVKDCRADSVHLGINLDMPYDGKDVIIGVQDWGFDYTHPMFFDSTLTHSRILASWDQFRTAGTPPGSFNYGTEIVGEFDLLALESDTASVYYDYSTHGSHVAGIAGGSGAGLEYRGVAYGSEFLFSQFYLDAASSIDAISWMSDYADNEGKRLVVNMSWGLYHLGPPDGSSLFSQALESFFNNGVVIVTSGGNNGNSDFHILHDFQNDTLRSRIQFFPYGAHANMWGQSISMWGEPNESFMAAFEVLDNSGILASSPHFFTTDINNMVDSYLVVNSDTIFYQLNIDSVYAFNNRPHIRMRIRNENTAYNVILVSSATSGQVHYWNVTELDNGAGNWGQDFQQFSGQGIVGDNAYGTGNPASTEHIITVGAHAPEVRLPNGTIHTGVIGSFSSKGPTLDERIKPDVTAPGVNIVSSISSFTTASYTSEATVSFKGRTYHFAAFSGTSMSSPVVTGVVALMLQANPNLTPQEVKDILMETAREDDKTGTLPASGNVEWGHGKVTAHAAVQKALEYLSVENIDEVEPVQVFPNPATDQLVVEWENVNIQRVEIYGLNGQLEKSVTIELTNKESISLEDILPGMHVLTVISAEGIHHAKFVKR